MVQNIWCFSWSGMINFNSAIFNETEILILPFRSAGVLLDPGHSWVGGFHVRPAYENQSTLDSPKNLENRSDNGRMPENLSSWWASSPSAPKRHGTITVWPLWVRQCTRNRDWLKRQFGCCIVIVYFAAQRIAYAYVTLCDMSNLICRMSTEYNQITSCCVLYKMYKR